MASGEKMVKGEARLIDRVTCEVVCGFCLYGWKDSPEHGVLVSFSERCLRDLRAAGSLRDMLGSCTSSLGPRNRIIPLLGIKRGLLVPGFCVGIYK